MATDDPQSSHRVDSILLDYASVRFLPKNPVFDRSMDTKIDSIISGLDNQGFKNLQHSSLITYFFILKMMFYHGSKYTYPWNFTNDSLKSVKLIVTNAKEIIDFSEKGSWFAILLKAAADSEYANNKELHDLCIKIRQQQDE